MGALSGHQNFTIIRENTKKVARVSLCLLQQSLRSLIIPQPYETLRLQRKRKRKDMEQLKLCG